jgi:hypothetical protein
MHAVAELPPKVPVVITDALGAEGLYILKAAERAALHLEERAEWILAETETPDGEIDYFAVPLATVRKVRVRYKFMGELEPMPYNWDD